VNRLRNRYEIRKFIDSVEQEILNLFCSTPGLSSREIAAVFSCSPHVIIARLRKYLSAKELVEISKNRLGIPSETILEMYLSGSFSPPQIAKTFKCDPGTIYKRLKRLLEPGEYDKWSKYYFAKSRPSGAAYNRLNLPEDEIIQMFQSTAFSLRDIASKFSCDRSAIRRILSQHFSDNELLRMGRRQQAIKISGSRHFAYLTLPEDQIIKEYLAGQSSVDLSKTYHCSQGRIKKVLRQHLSAEQIRENMRRAQSHKNTGCIVPDWYRKVLRERVGIKHPMFGKQWTSDQKARHRLVVPRGPKHPAWKGGITPESLMFIASFEWKDVAARVRQRDSFTCRACTQDHVAIVHHIIPRSLDPERKLWLDTENLVTICKACHGIVEPYHWKQLPTVSEIAGHYRKHGLRLPTKLVDYLLDRLNGTS
jgi:predicted DNA-binding protein YlxM (UPF0122 family)